MKGSSSKLILVLIVLAAICFSVLSYIGIGSTHFLGVGGIRQGLDLKGGVSITYEAEKIGVTPAEMDSAISLIRRRLDRKNYTEAEVAKQGDNRIRVEIPGVENAEQAVSEIGKTALLTFKDEAGNVILTGADVKTATKQVRSSQGAPTDIVVALEFSDNGKALFEKATGENIGKKIIISLDEDLVSEPSVNEKITGGNAEIRGNFTAATAEELATQIREGSLPFKLTVMSVDTVGATLGVNALNTSAVAGVIGAVLVFIFMAIAYKLLGFAADLALVLYVSLLIVIVSVTKITLTLPGIAGIILSIGMAVDANVVIFERIKEELRSGRNIRSSVDAGFKRAFPAILDSNVTTLISAVVLFWLGTGPIKGFAQTLSIGILLSMFTALFITRQIVTNLVGAGIGNNKLYGGVEQ